MVTWPSSLLSSSSLRTASWMWRGLMRFFLLSRAALPAAATWGVSGMTGAVHCPLSGQTQVKRPPSADLLCCVAEYP